MNIGMISALSSVIASKLAEANVPNYRNILWAISINSKAFTILGVTPKEIDEVKEKLLNDLDLWMMDDDRFTSLTGPRMITETDFDIVLELQDIYNIAVLANDSVAARDWDFPGTLPYTNPNDVIKSTITSNDYNETTKVIAWELMYKNKFGCQFIFLNEGIPPDFPSDKYPGLVKARAYYYR